MLALEGCLVKKSTHKECPKEHRFSFVVSYRALIENSQINPFKGLSGKYASSVFIESLDEVKEQYNIYENRDIYKYPLELSRQEIQQIIAIITEDYWNYKSRYYFSWQNCATELRDILQVALRKARFTYSKARTPYSLLRALKKVFLLKKVG